MTLNVPNPNQTDALIDAILPLCHAHQIFCFEGDLGAGKTTFIKQICEHLNVTTSTSSPTFSIVNEYDREGGNRVLHFDLYRIKHPEELVQIGWYDYINQGNLMFVEWPEMAGDYLPTDAVRVTIEQNEDDSRTVNIKLPK